MENLKKHLKKREKKCHKKYLFSCFSPKKCLFLMRNSKKNLVF
ncbi:hypothetical protein HMPREF0557_00633 [Listeria innocua ATCC 33091]|uniref:Uncharacterized protein n=1 Tax=Listeria innocua ATCC 33091 TaxID=1002366 RepID=A0AB72ZB74_LISIO|nr:hypothetical protein HMPREF0557_00633 [Listeria innocua ATCC 33091]